jgi:transposase-like protein
MATVDQAEVTRRLAAIKLAQAERRPMADAARALGVSANTLRNWWRCHLETGSVAPAPEPMAPLPPREIHDAAFWKRKAIEAARQATENRLLAEKLAGMHEVPTSPPIWSQPPERKGGRSIFIAHTSDVHAGEVISPGEIDGINAYDIDICRDRMKRYFEAVCTIAPRWLHGSECDGVLLTMGGDLISGDIHDELTRTNDLTSHEQVAAVIEIYAAGIAMLREVFGAVHVVAVPGNHGRTTVKPTAKLAARLSYDILAASMLRARISDPAVTWQIATGADVVVPLYGRNLLVTHGDRIGTAGGMGFAGPELPIIRGAHKIRQQAQSVRRLIDLILMGHYHTSTAVRGVLANGSVVGYSEYGNSLRAAVEPPQQWLARYSLAWGLCERLAVQLSDPKPKVRIKDVA